VAFDEEEAMRKSRVPREIVRLNGAAFRLNSEEVRAGNLEALVDEALSRVLGGVTLDGCVQYSCSMYAPASPS
jgi:hypothetical protein